MGPGDGGRDCPECGDPLPAAASYCPHCETALDGSTVDLSELDGLLDEGDVADLVEADAGGRRASGPVRLVSGLAVSLPLAPLVLFLVGSVVALSAPESVAVVCLVLATGCLALGTFVAGQARGNVENPTLDGPRE